MDCNEACRLWGLLVGDITLVLAKSNTTNSENMAEGNDSKGGSCAKRIPGHLNYGSLSTIAILEE